MPQNQATIHHTKLMYYNTMHEKYGNINTSTRRILRLDVITKN